MAQKFEQQPRLATSSTQMQIGDPDGAEADPAVAFIVHRALVSPRASYSGACASSVASAQAEGEATARCARSAYRQLSNDNVVQRHKPLICGAVRSDVAQG